jgi:RsiW-degrading membrane proteinase PrsW (M82 family)
MKPLRFSFKSEPIWMLVFSLGLGAIGLLLATVFEFARKAGH